MQISDLITAAESTLKKNFRASEPAALLNSDVFIWVKEAYDIIVDQLRDYVGVDSFNATNAVNEYDFPTDLFGDIEGIIAVVVGGSGIDRGFWHEVVSKYRDDPFDMDNKSVPQAYVKWDTDKFAIIPAPSTSDGLAVLVYYVKEAPIPTSVSDTVPRYFASGFRQAITSYIISCAKEAMGEDGSKYYERFMMSINAKKVVKTQNAKQYDLNQFEDVANQ